MTGHVMITLILFFLPVVGYVIYKSRRIKQELAEAERQGTPFVAPPARSSNVLLRGLLPEEQIYAAQQIKFAFSAYLFVVWVCLLIFTLPLFFPFMASEWSDPAVLMWQEFVLGLGRNVTLLGSLLGFAAFIAISPLRIGGDGRFYRTRPLRVGFLYAWRVLPVLASFLAGLATGLVLACGVVYLLHGAVWNHLPPQIPRALALDDTYEVEQYRALLRTSVPIMAVSLLTTASLLFSMFLALALLPIKRWAGQGMPLLLAPALMLTAIFPITLTTLSDFGVVHVPTILFLYQRIGPPPSLAFALGPIAMSAAFLLLGRIFASHIEL